MASKDGLDLSRFYDSEQREHSSTQDFSAAEIARRPWKAFWPPRSEETFNIWLRSEFPEVLSWRFDPDQPFDQPWRDWLRSILMKDEDGSCQKKYSWNGNQAEPNKSDLSSTSTMDIDDQITGLPKIQVDSFKYLAPLDIYRTEKPFFSQLPCGTQLPRTNLVESNHPVEIHDICGKESLFKLDEAGFQFMQVPTRISEWTDESVQAEYLPELSAWLKEYFSCKEVFIYNYNLRTNDREETGKGPWRSPIFRVHCGNFHSRAISNIWLKSLDNTPGSCAKRLEFQFPAKVEAISSGRYRYIDIWRCVTGQDVDSPLALCDYRSIATTDLWNIDIVYPHFSEEGYELTYSPTHRWFYKKRMSKDDAVLFKLGDNLATAAQFAPHAAFIDLSASGNCKRASIEVRAIIIG